MADVCGATLGRCPPIQPSIRFVDGWPVPLVCGPPPPPPPPIRAAAPQLCSALIRMKIGAQTSDIHSVLDEPWPEPPINLDSIFDGDLGTCLVCAPTHAPHTATPPPVCFLAASSACLFSSGQPGAGGARPTCHPDLGACTWPLFPSAAKKKNARACLALPSLPFPSRALTVAHRQTHPCLPSVRAHARVRSTPGHSRYVAMTAPPPSTPFLRPSPFPAPAQPTTSTTR